MSCKFPGGSDASAAEISLREPLAETNHGRPGLQLPYSQMWPRIFRVLLDMRRLLETSRNYFTFLIKRIVHFVPPHPRCSALDREVMLEIVGHILCP